MSQEHAGVVIASTLDSPEAIKTWKADPVAYLENSGFSLSHLDDTSKHVFGSYLANTEVRIFGGAVGCLGCKIVVGGTLVGLTAALVAFIAGLVIGSDGVDAAVAPGEVAAGAAGMEGTVGAEVGLSAERVGEIIVDVLRGFITWAKANPIKAAALIAAGTSAVEEILSEITGAICKASGACSE